jgi:hemolysin III
METSLELKPTWRGILHTAAFCVTLPAGLFLLTAAHTTAARVAVAVYWASLAGLFGASASYHRLAVTERARMWLRRADHSAIFCLIAGTYTPLCLLVLPKAWGVPTLVAIWVAAVAGIILKMVSVRATGRTRGGWLYIVMGWAAVITMPQLAHRLDTTGLVLLAVGGVVYTVGAVILATQRPNPSARVFGYHEVWHACTIVAGGCHFALMASIVR